MRLSQRIASLRPSATIEVKVAADRMKERGVDVIDFGPGEPDFNTPENVKAAAHKAIDDDLSHYLPPLGLKSLRQAIAARYAKRNDCDYQEDEVLVGAGAKSVLYIASMALVSEGDEVIIPSPYWVSFPEQVKLAGGEPIVLPTSEREGFIPRAMAAESLMTQRTRGIILCSPSNPTGAVMPQDEVNQFVDLAAANDLFLIFDETYEHFLYDGATHATPAAAGKRIRDNLLLISSVSKSYAMTGWRVGYAAGPRDVIKAMAAIQGHDITHATAIAQAAAAEAISGPQDSLGVMIREYANRRKNILEGLDGINGITCHPPGGAFYVFPNVTGLYDKFRVKDSIGVSRCLLEEAKVATVPGEAFGAPGYLRLSYALVLDRIQEGIERIRRCAG